MDKKAILSRIKSQYIVPNIFSYIDYENNQFSLKLFNYSKKFQKILGIRLFNYQDKYIRNLGMKLNKYLLINNTSNIYFNLKKYNKEILKTNFQKDLLKSKVDEKDMNKYLINYYERFIGNKEELKADEKSIDIFSPFFDILSKEPFFKELFIIPIKISNVKKYNLIDDYISAFSKLNTLYPTLNIYYTDVNDVYYLVDFKANINLIDSLIIQPEEDKYIDDNNYIFDALSSLPNLKNNLIYLDIKGTIEEDTKNNFGIANNFEDNNEQIKLNDFKSLQVLKLTNFHFKKEFILKLTNLRELYLNNCKNISFEDDIFINLKKISLNSIDINQKNKIKCPKLEEIEYFGKYRDIFDYGSLEKLKNLNIEYCDIENYINSPLEYVSIERSNKRNEKDNFKKLLSNKFLKRIKIKIVTINDNDMGLVKEKNNSVKELNINWNNQDNDCILYNLQNKFPNLSSLNITSKNIYDNNGFSKVEIEENPEVNVNKISITGQNKIFKLYVHSFEKLKYISLNFIDEIKNIKEIIPFFNNKCDIIFISLTHFEFKYNTMSSDSKSKNVEILHNLYNNMDKIPNIRNFYFSCNSKGVDEVFYENFIKKILLFRLNKIELDIQIDDNIKVNRFYSREELKKLCPYMYFGIQDISIYKLKK